MNLTVRFSDGESIFVELSSGWMTLRKLFDSIQLFEETISYHIGHPPVETL